MAFIDKKILEQETEANELTDYASQTCKAGYITQKTHVDNEFVDVTPNNIVYLSNFRFDILSGSVKKCHDKTTIHSNCCSDSGWFKAAGLVKCSAAQISLVIERSKGNCGYIGEYCTKKILGHCITKTKSYCCFPTVLSKIIHCGARDQLGKSLGSAEHPQCRGLTLDDIEKIDFSLINFDEFFNLEAHKTIEAYNDQINYNTQITLENRNSVKMPSEINMDLWNNFKDKSIADNCKAIEDFVVKLNLFMASKDSDLIVDSKRINKEAYQQRASSILDSVFNQVYQVHSNTEIKTPELNNIQKFILVDRQEKDNSDSEFETMYENLAEQQEMPTPLFGEIKDNVLEGA